MLYEARMARDYGAWQQIGQEEIGNLPNEHSTVLSEHLGRNIGAYGVFGTAFYDIAHDGRLAAPESRATVARQSILLAGALELTDDTIDQPFPGRDLSDIEKFLDNIRDTLLDGTGHECVLPVSLPERQIACYSIAQYTHRLLQLHIPEHRSLMSDVVARLKQPVLQQFIADDPTDLLSIGQQLTGLCTEATTLAGEFTDQTQYPNIRQASWQFGALAGTLDHGSEILDDLAEGSNTFATAYIHKHGPSTATLRDIAEIRREAARQAYTDGLSLLESRRQRSIYRTAARVVGARYAAKRAIQRISPAKVEAILQQTSRHSSTEKIAA